jgi:hypothetical protein
MGILAFTIIQGGGSVVPTVQPNPQWQMDTSNEINASPLCTFCTPFWAMRIRSKGVLEIMYLFLKILLIVQTLALL